VSARSGHGSCDGSAVVAYICGVLKTLVR
jgi:hypothetical protein